MRGGAGARGDRGRDDPVCPACTTTIESDVAVVFQHGDLFHQRCYEALMAAKKPPRRATLPKRDDARDGESRQA